MEKLNLFLGVALALGTVLAVSCREETPNPTATVTVTKTAPSTPGVAPTVTTTTTVTATAPAGTVTVTPTPTPSKLVKLRDSVPTGGSALFFVGVGQEQGYFEKRGIDLTALEMAAAAAKVGPFMGQAEISQGDIFPFYPERKDTRIIGPHQNSHFSVVVRKDSPYKSYQDLKGKKIGTQGPATALYQLAKVVTGLEGLNLEKDFQLTISDSAAVQIGWLLKGEVEAIHLYEPFTSKLLISDGDKVRELYWLNDLYKKYTGSSWLLGGIYAAEDWVTKNTELARQVGLAFDDIFSYVYANDQVWRSDVTKKFWQVEDPKVLELLVQRMPGIVEHPRYGPAYKAAMVKRAQLHADAGVLPREAVDWVRGVLLFADTWGKGAR